MSEYRFTYTRPEGTLYVNVKPAQTVKDFDFTEFIKPLLEVTTGDSSVQVITHRYQIRTTMYSLALPPWTPLVSPRTGERQTWAVLGGYEASFHTVPGFNVVPQRSHMYDKLRKLVTSVLDEFTKEHPEWVKLSNVLQIERDLLMAMEYAKKLAAQQAEIQATITTLEKELHHAVTKTNAK